jgi:ParB family chromosome partitioning protein
MTTDHALAAALDDVLGAAPTPKPAPPRVAPAAAPMAVPPEGGLFEVLLNEIHPDPDNPREDLGDIDDLARSIREQGLIQPMIVRRADDDRLVIVAGHRRYAALRRLGRTRGEVIIRKAMAADDVLAKMLVENGQRAGLDPIEEARGLQRLKTLGGLSDLELARKIGRSQPLVSGRLALLALPAEDQEAVRARQLKVGAAVRTARLASGRVRKTGISKAWHLGPDHSLSRNAAARCRRLAHKTGRSVGGIACGECWESVIRADERQHLHATSAQQSRCVVCGSESAFAALTTPTAPNGDPS